MVDIRGTQDCRHFLYFFLLYAVCVFYPNPHIGVIVLLGDRIVLICKGNDINERIHHCPSLHYGADAFSRINPVHNRNDHRILCHCMRDVCAHFLQRVVFYTHENVILFAKFIHCNYTLRSYNNLAFVVTVQCQTVFPDTFPSRAARRKRQVRAYSAKHRRQISAYAADADDCDFLFCQIIFSHYIFSYLDLIHHCMGQADSFHQDLMRPFPLRVSPRMSSLPPASAQDYPPPLLCQRL